MVRLVITLVAILLTGILAPHVEAAADCTIATNAFQEWWDYSQTPPCRQCLGGSEVACGTQGVKPRVSTFTGMSGASVSVSDAILAGSIVLVVTTEITTTVTGSGVTGFHIGDGTHINRWGTQTTLTAGATTSVANIPLAHTSNVIQTQTPIVLTAIGGSFSGGSVTAIVQYTDGSLYGSQPATDTFQVRADGVDAQADYLINKVMGDGNIGTSVALDGGVRKVRFSIIGSTVQDKLVAIDGTDTLADFLINKLIAGNDVVCTQDPATGNKRLKCGVAPWTKTVAIPAGAWSTLNCAAPTEAQLTTTKRKGWYIRNCAGAGDTNELHLTYKLPPEVNCSAPIRLRLFAEWAHPQGTAPGPSTQVTFRTQGWVFGAGDTDPNIMSTTMDGQGNTADTKPINFSASHVLGTLLTDPLVVHGTCSAGDMLALRVTLLGSQSTAGAVANIAISEAELIYGLNKLSHQ